MNTATPTESFPSPRRILIVDDMVDFGQSLAEVLTLEGYEAVVAASSDEAFQRLDSFVPEVALMDIRLGEGVNGVDLMGQLKVGHPDLQVIIMTAYASVDTAIGALENGAYCYLRKPINEGELLITLDRCFESIELIRKKQKAELEYRHLFDNLPDIFFRMTLSGDITLISPSFETITGYAPHEIIGKNIRDFSGVDERLFQLLEAARSGTLPDRQEIKFLAKDGKPRSISINMRIMHDEAGEVVGLEGTARDETQVKNMEKDRLRLAAAVEQSAEMMIITETDGTIIYANSAFERVTGYGKDEVIGQPIHAFQQKTTENGKFSRTWGEARTKGTSFCRLQNRKKDGSVYEETVATSAIRNERGDVMNYLLLKRDITNEVQVSRQLAHSQKMEAIATLAGGIAHDFNNILGAIVGYADLCRTMVNPGTTIHDYLDRMMTASQRAKDLIRQILAISRDDIHIKETFVMESLVDEVIKLLRATLPATIEIKNNIAEPTVSVEADPSKIHQVLMNLATNASHAMRDTMGVLTIDVTTIDLGEKASQLSGELKPGRYVRVSVGDTGQGIAQEIRDRIFEPFFTTKPEDVGTGLGLSTAHGIISSHGGTITIDSQQGKGSTFHVYLPCIDAVTARREEKRSIAKKIGTGQHILIVDDEPDIAEIGEAMLLHLGFTVTSENNPANALERFRAESDRFDLIITDQTMPEMTGIMLIEKIREINPTIPIILCSGTKIDDVEKKCRQLAIPVFMLKPFNSMDLAQNVVTALAI